MTLKRKTRPLGGSLLVAVPSQFAASLGIAAGDYVSIEIENKKIVLAPLPPVLPDHNGSGTNLPGNP